mmetsp:Transcript_99119/g.314664  ORF Transcript_99119/g.314664 Transcript_99119/m.314664 type:complete len:131 (+) Transcript_99119:76-468(+)
MPSGTVKKWIGDKGFGFISPSDGGEDIFVHMKALSNGNDYLTEGEAVEFEAEFSAQKGKVEVVSCSGGYKGGPWSGSQGGGYGRAKGGAGGKGFGGSSPYGGKGAGGQEVCRNFQRWGECEFGDSCKFSH